MPATIPPLAHLWRDVVGCAAECGGGDSVLDALLAHAEVGDLAVTVAVQQDVVQLEVSVQI